MAGRLIKRLNDLENIFIVGYEKQLLKNLIELIKLRNGQIYLIKRCYNDFYADLSLNTNEELHLHLLKNFKNILALVTAIDIYKDNDLLFTNIFEDVEKTIRHEINRKSKIFIKYEKTWEEIKKEINEFWINTKEEIEYHKGKISIYRFSLEKWLKKLNEYDPN